jgi:serine/threonine-protein kinase
MTPDRWRQITRVFHDALARDAWTREPFLDEVCSGDEALRAEVSALLEAHQNAGEFGESPIGAFPHGAADASAEFGSPDMEAVPWMGGPCDTEETCLRRRVTGVRLTSPSNNVYPPQGIGAGSSEPAIINLARMALAPGTRLASYEILSAIGAGGMGEVYRARDTRLRRDVAIKVLPESVSGDPERLARFQREARVLASLNHPNIGAIYGLEAGALILELVEGETLAEMCARGAMPVPEALSIARKICDALDAAHDQGVIHRDLKPANIKVRPDGSVKVLDFGLSKAVDMRVPGDDDSALSTVTAAPVTAMGVILGTPAYMSPEQARGNPVDKRSDIWSFGCVLYEMLSGARAFEGNEVADILSRVLQRAPDFAVLPRDTPAVIRRLLGRCLEKDRGKRPPQIAVVAFQIDEVLAAGSAELPGAGDTGSIRSAPGARWIAPALVAGVALGAAGIWLLGQRQPTHAVLVTRLQMTVAPADQIGGTDGRPTRPAFALSPDGRTLVFSAVQKGQRALYVRPFDRSDAAVIAGTEGGLNPFFSPDGQWVGYWAAGQIRKVPLRGGPSVPILAPSETGQALQQIPIFGASWGGDDRIVFAQGAGGLLEISASGGSLTERTKTNSERREFSHRLPHVLPGGDAVLFTVTHNRFPHWDETQIWAHSRSSRQSKLLIEGGADARYVSSGHLLYVRDGALLATPFDVQRLEVTGGPVGVVPEIMQAAYVPGQLGDSGAMQLSVSTSGTLVYITGGVEIPLEFSVVEVDRTGRERALPIEPKAYRTLRLSPDGARLALGSLGRDRSLWLHDFARGTLSKLAGAGRSIVPVWTSDGERITYASSANGPDNLYSIRADGGGSPTLLVPSASNLVPGAWTPDGRQLLYYVTSTQVATAAGSTIWALDVVDKTAPRAVAGALGSAGGVDISPDGRWVAYQSSESGQFQIYVDAFPGPGPRYQVSTDGGGSPIWRGDGRELFYLASGRAAGRQDEGEGRVESEAEVRVMSVSVTPRETLAFGAPRQLFAGRYGINRPARGYDVSRDGQRFLLLKPRERRPSAVTEMSIVQNWTAELK